MVVAVAISVVSLGAVGLSDSSPQNSLQGTSENMQMEEGVNVEVYKNGEKVVETHNELMEGKAAIENAIKSGNVDAYNTIVVGNGTAPSTGDGSLDSEWSSCGLSGQATSASGNSLEDINGDDGEWNLTVTWDSITCDDVIVNTTAQKSATAGSSYDYFAGAALSRDINLYSGDSLTIEWNNDVTGSGN